MEGVTVEELAKVIEGGADVDLKDEVSGMSVCACRLEGGRGELHEFVCVCVCVYVCLCVCCVYI